MKTDLLIHAYLREMMKASASDMFITVGCPPSMRVGSRVVALNIPPFQAEDIQALIENMLSADQHDEFLSTLELNLALAIQEGQRFRISLFRQKGEMGMVIRLIKSRIPTFEELNITSVYSDMIMEKRGLILMVGATGSGKSTSLASMIDYRNRHGTGHIITIEDPIEYYHDHKGCIITQREVGVDTYSYGMALKNALRQSPDVLMIGEIRDRETMENAVLFCETGHLVVATLHANNANQAIERIINLFPEEMHKQILKTLSNNLKAIFSQRLVENVRGGKSLAYEIMLNEGLIKNLIDEGKIKELKDIIEKNRDSGMISFDQCLFDMLERKVITSEVALKEADNANNLRLKITQGRGYSQHAGSISLKPSNTEEF
jgi:twitching motility protein PilU